MIAGTDQEGVKAWTPDFSEVPEEELNEFIKTSSYCEKKKKQLEFVQLMKEMLGEFSEQCNVHVRTYFFDYGGKEITIKGNGYAELVSLIMQTTTMGMRKDAVSSIISDFKNSKEESEKKDGDEKKEEEPMMEEMMEMM